MLRIEHIAIKDNRPFRVVNRSLLEQEIKGLPKGRYRLLIEKKRNKKSNAQLGYLFSVIYPIVLQDLINAGWEFSTVDEVDIYCKSLFANKEILNRDTAEIVNIPALKRDMTTTEFATYINTIRQWDAEFLGGYVPEPNEQIKMKL
jgi:hypothetical protein